MSIALYQSLVCLVICFVMGLISILSVTLRYHAQGPDLLP
jgi:hypothetical protein